MPIPRLTRSFDGSPLLLRQRPPILNMKHKFPHSLATAYHQPPPPMPCTFHAPRLPAPAFQNVTLQPLFPLSTMLTSVPHLLSPSQLPWLKCHSVEVFPDLPVGMKPPLLSLTPCLSYIAPITTSVHIYLWFSD